MASNELFQYSIVTALMDGVASNGVPIQSLQKYGDYGLGTFRYMDGELIMVDGRLYRMKCDDTVTQIDWETAAAMITPFAMVTFFRPTVAVRISFRGKAQLSEALSSLFPSNKNHYLSFSIEGAFKTVTVRTAGGQRVEHERLAEIGKRQISHTFEALDGGFVFGFRTPSYLQGISVAGDHFHFISSDKKRGGHVLEMSGDEVELRAALISKIQLHLPEHDSDFNAAQLKHDDEGISAVEG